MNRKEAYAALSFHLGIPFKFTHIGLMNEEQCHEIIDWSKKYLKENNYESTKQITEQTKENNLPYSENFVSLFPDD